MSGSFRPECITIVIYPSKELRVAKVASDLLCTHREAIWPAVVFVVLNDVGVLPESICIASLYTLRES